MLIMTIFTPKSVKSNSHLLYFHSEMYKKFKECYSTKSNDGISETNDCDITLPPQPQDCCMSGCANCVWIAYAKEIAKLIDDGGVTARRKIFESVKDPNLRAFLMLELSHLFKKDKK